MLKFEDFREIRWIKFANRLTQIILSLTLALGLNYLAATHFTRTDFTRQNQYSLSPETLAHIAEISRDPSGEPVVIYVTLPRESDIEGTQEVVRDVDRLLREFEFAARKDGKKWIRIEQVDMFQQRAKAQELQEKFGVKDIKTAMVIARGDRFRVIPSTDLYEWKDQAPVAFLGERVVASALLDVACTPPGKVYFVLGHGEMNISDVDPNEGISDAVTALRQRNLVPEPLVLVGNSVPDDAALVVIAGPQKPFLPEEVEVLRRYLEDRHGRLLVFIDPRQQHGLDQLFYEWGLYADDRLIIDIGPQADTGSGDVLYTMFADHPITLALAQNNLPILLGPARPVRKDLGAPLDERLVVRELLTSSPKSWGEIDFRLSNSEAAQTFDPVRDIQGPLAVASLAERSGGSQIGISLQGGRIIAVGSTGLISNRRFYKLGNEWLFMNMVNWLLDKENLLNVPPQPVRTFSLALAKDDYTRIGLHFLILPAAVGLLGIIMFWVRRS